MVPKLRHTVQTTVGILQTWFKRVFNIQKQQLRVQHLPRTSTTNGLTFPDTMPNMFLSITCLLPCLGASGAVDVVAVVATRCVGNNCLGVDQARFVILLGHAQTMGDFRTVDFMFKLWLVFVQTRFNMWSTFFVYAPQLCNKFENI